MKSTWKRCTKCFKIYPNTNKFFNRITKKGSRTDLNTRCKQCTKAWVAQHYQKNKERINAKNAEWAKNHPEESKAIKQRYLKNNPEKRRNSVKRYRERNKVECDRRIGEWKVKHRDLVNERARKAYWRNPEESRERGRKYNKSPKGVEYRKTPKARLIAKVVLHRRLARKHSLPDTMTAQDWQRALDYFKGCCAVCGRPPGLWHTLAMDHWIPLSSPDCLGTVPENIVPVCHARKDGEGSCNNSKGNKPADQWLVAKFGEKKAKKILKRIHTYFDSLTFQSAAET